jgi:hypothetical protein
MIGDATQSLIRDVFQRDDLFRDAPRIEKRLVAWEPGAKPIAVPHSAVVVSEQQLSLRLRPPAGSAFNPGDPSPPWTIHASPPLPAQIVDHRFGTRIAAAVHVRLNDASDATACSIEALEGGWLFLIPAGDRSGWLLAVGGPPAALLSQSHLIHPQISELIGPAAQFPAYPRISDPFCGPGWLACGVTALSFDPLCGEGTGNAVREAILASAVIRAALGGSSDVDGLLAHYRARLFGGFYRHLELCREFYSRGRTGPWWNVELDHLLNGLEYCKAQPAMRYRYQLSGFELQPLP